MKRFSLVLAFFMIFMISSSEVFAAGEQFKIKMNGETQMVTKVPIIKDGKNLGADFPPFVYIDKTLVPVRVVSENLGAKVGWDGQTNTTIIEAKGKKILLTINSSVAVIDGKNVNLDKNAIPKLVVYPGQVDAKTVVPLDFISKALGYDVKWDEATKSVSIFSEAKEEQKPEEETKPTDNGKVEVDYSKLNNIKSIKKENIEGQDVLVLEGTKEFKVNTMTLDNPKRVVVDVLNGYIGENKSENYNYDVGYISGVRVSQFSPDGNYNKDDKIVRVVLDIKDGVDKPDLEIKNSGNKLYIKPSKNVWNTIKLSSKSGAGSFSIDTLKRTTYSLDYNKANKTMTISLPSGDVDLENTNMTVGDSLISDISVNKSGGMTSIKLKFRRDIEYTEVSSRTTDKIVVDYKRNSNIKPSDLIIVLDAGHGGTDPGSSSANGVKEKDVTFAVTNNVKAGLESKGYNVIMTRDTDVKIELKERADIANRNFADIFVSIHANSATSASPNGIELLYAPSEKGSEKQEGQLVLNRIILEELLKETGATNRKLKERPNLVVIRESKMPATLIELGFLSNPTEEKLLNDPAYQAKLANAIVKGIERYFKEY